MGDFSRWPLLKKGYNFIDILHQEGRVLSDSDGTTKTRLDNDWRKVSAGDIIGKGVAAIPADEPNSFKVQSAKVDTTQTQQERILVEVMSGRAWVDGMLVYLENDPPQVTRLASYLGPPFHNVPPPAIITGARDAVILEVYQDAVNAFQLPDSLLEPALGGPDTTEMLHTSLAFRLLRLSQDDNCSTIPGKVEDKLSDRGRLTVSLQRNPPMGGDCPVDENYGYTGLTHNLYRIEIADINSGPPKFKYSQFNGGLVGRGKYTDSSRTKLRITHNDQAIFWSGLTDFYLEIVTFDKEKGYWNVSYGTSVTLNSEKELVLSGTPVFGNLPPPPEEQDPEHPDGNGIFFRLWNGIRDIDEFTVDAPPTILIDGIRLKFELPTASNYRPQDYWIFQVRAGGIENDEKLIDNSPPHGIRYHRVPLAIIEWDVQEPPSPTTASVIEDCRVIFPPLTEQKGGCCCCLVSVGDGFSSHGDYDLLQDAINSIGESGGEICLLDGMHRANAIVDQKNNLVIRGCGNRTKVVNNDGKSPIITIQNSSHIKGSSNILIEGIEFVTHNEGAIRIDGTITQQPLKQIKVQGNTIRSVGIPDPTKALVEIIDGIDINVYDNNIVLQEDNIIRTGIYLKGKNITIAKNVISVVPNIITIARSLMGEGVGDGFRIGNESEDITIIQNEIDGGFGNGITLGDPRFPGDSSLHFIYKVRLEGNKISNMGLCGIGVPRLPHFDSREIPDRDALGTWVSDMEICGNYISNCLKRQFDESMLEEIGLSSYGLPCRGFSGILLTSCEGLVIKDNRIEDNGSQHSDPVCGIFIYYLSEGQIINNYIFNNGGLGGMEDRRIGPRGGIVLPFSINAASEYETYSARIHDNVIVQPTGRALLLGSWGMASVLNNYFRSERFDFLATQFKFLSEVVGGCVSIFFQGASVKVPRVGSRRIAGAAAYGLGLIFQGNQSVLGYDNEADVSHYIVGSIGSDLSFGSNEVYCENSGIYINTFLYAKTLRAYENRLSEPSGISLWSRGTTANITVNNQGDHCIITEPDPNSHGNPLPTVKTGNQELTFCGIVTLDKIHAKAVEVVRSYE
jgi:hypothetical protein